MKNIIKNSLKILTLIVFISNFALSSSIPVLGNNIKDYDKIFEKISQTRVGIDSKEIDSIKNPFVVIYKHTKKNGNKTKKARATYRLNAIFNNRAMINNRWYKRYSKIGTYKLVKIKKNSVIIKNKYTSKELFIRKKNESKIKFSSK